MHILIAPNAFKDSLDAGAAADAIKEGLQDSLLNCTCDCFPVGDGGDGTGRLITERCDGEFIDCRVSDPLGRPGNACYGLIDNGRTAVIEMAEASGIRLLTPGERNPLKASSVGTGELIRFALERQVDRLIVAMGGSATVDGGTGILKALGVRFLNEQGEEIGDLPSGLRMLHSVDLSGLDERIRRCEVFVLCDVKNELLGTQGAAGVFGPQKGATEQEVVILEEALERLRDVALAETGKDMAGVQGGGTAGGAAVGLYTFLNAKLVNGIDHYLQVTGFDDALRRADLVITGEGSIDRQTLQGKGPYGVAVRANERGVPVIGIAGKVPLMRDPELNKYFDVLLPIGDGPVDIGTAMRNTRENLRRTASQIGNLLGLK